MGKKKNNVISYKTEEQQEIIKFLVLVLVIIGIVIGIYYFTRNFVTKENKNEETQETVEASINYNVTIVGSILNRPEEVYYVMVYDSTSVKANRFSSIYSSYSNTNSDTKMYVVDLNNSLNASYVAEKDSNPKATEISDLQFGEFTLIKVKKGKIVKYLEDIDEVKSELKINKD